MICFNFVLNIYVTKDDIITCDCSFFFTVSLAKLTIYLRSPLLLQNLGKGN